MSGDSRLPGFTSKILARRLLSMYSGALRAVGRPGGGWIGRRGMLGKPHCEFTRRSSVAFSTRSPSRRPVTITGITDRFNDYLTTGNSRAEARAAPDHVRIGPESLRQSDAAMRATPSAALDMPLDMPLDTQGSPTQASGVPVAMRDAVSFLIPALMFVELELVGRLFVSEALFLVAIPWLLPQARVANPGWLRILTSAGLIWLGGQILTDVIRDASFFDYSRGWSKIAFMLTDLLAISLIVGRSPRRLVLFSLGLATSSVIGYFVAPNIFAIDDPFKWAFALPITVSVLSVATVGHWRRPHLVASLGLAWMAIINLFGDFRSLAGICIVTVAYLAVGPLVASRSMQSGRSAKRFLLVGAVVFVAGLVAIQGYAVAADSGLLGDEAKAKYQEQAGGGLGLVLGGRSEALVSYQAILDSPIIGHGSWAKDYQYVDLLTERLRQLGYQPFQLYVESGLIPSHSYLFGAWVEAGVVGGIFWLVVLAITVRALVQMSRVRPRVAPLVAFLSISLLWDILFSPFGAQARVSAALALVAVMLVRPLTTGNERQGAR